MSALAREVTSYRPPAGWVASLREFVATHQATAAHCELCRAPIEDRHAHLFDAQAQRLLCACASCALLYAGHASGRYRRVPAGVARLDGFGLSDAQWEALQIPINLAFFVRNSARKRMLALYPGPAGAMESALDLDAWRDPDGGFPVLPDLAEDVEALLVNRVAGAREYYRVPIDRCYELVGTIRSHWHGLSGGHGARAAIEAFFGGLRRDADWPATLHAKDRVHD